MDTYEYSLGYDATARPSYRGKKKSVEQLEAEGWECAGILDPVYGNRWMRRRIETDRPVPVRPLHRRHRCLRAAVLRHRRLDPALALVAILAVGGGFVVTGLAAARYGIELLRVPDPNDGAPGPWTGSVTRKASAQDRRRVAWYVKNFPGSSVAGIARGLSMEEELVLLALRELHAAKKLDGAKVKGFTPFPTPPPNRDLFPLTPRPENS